MMMYPVDILSGRVGGLGSAGLVGLQLLWLALTLTAGQLAPGPAVGDWRCMVVDLHLAPHRPVLASRMRSQRTYRANFLLDLASSLLIGLVELAKVWVIFRSVGSRWRPRPGGSRAGLRDRGRRVLARGPGVRTLRHDPDVPARGHPRRLYLRPQPLLAQLITSDVSLRRLARAAVDSPRSSSA
jgi:hypothetical protein